MNSLTLSRCALGVCAAATLLVGCGGLQPAGVAQGPVPQGQMPENSSSVSGVRQSPRSVRHGSVTETVLHSFQGYPNDGSDPESGLTYLNGTLYGTTDEGGAGGGTVYSITPSGTETVLHVFKGGRDGAGPDARMIVRNGTLYGTTGNGGGKCPQSSLGCGTVFSITPSSHRSRVTVLHRFAGPPDGSNPEARLLNVNGTLYGTTELGGKSCAVSVGGGCGTVFSITPGGKEKVLYSFGGGSDGAFPTAGLIDLKGTLYGTNARGGAYNNGTVFSITPGGKEKVLYSFGYYGASAVVPSGLVDVSGTFYGTTTRGGGYGTVFSITPAGKEKVLYSFKSGADGAFPGATLLNVNGTLYGTTCCGGPNCCGTVFSVTLSGHETVLYSFKDNPDGSYPASGLSYVNGTFYGTTELGGVHYDGTVYSITP